MDCSYGEKEYEVPFISTVGNGWRRMSGLRLKEVVTIPRSAAHSVYVHVRVFGGVHLHHPIYVREVESSVHTGYGEREM